MKINCLIQATFGCLTISEPSLNQDIARIFRNTLRISKCLVEYLSTQNKGFAALYNAVVLSKCFKARLWENSKFVSRQLEKIGVSFSNLLVNSGITTIGDILKTNPREIELILKRNPPFGTGVIDSARQIPKYSLQVEQNSPFTGSTASINIIVKLENIDDVLEARSEHNPCCYILIGNAANKTVFFKKIGNTVFFREQCWVKKVDITKSEKGNEINIYVISDTYVGVDIHESYLLIYSSFDDDLHSLKRKNEISTTEKAMIKCNSKKINLTSETRTRDCDHKCMNKDTCFHLCCKVGVAVTVPKKSQLSNFMEQLQNKNKLYESPKKVKIGGVGTFSENIKIFERSHCKNNILKNSYITSEEKSKSKSSQKTDLRVKENNYYNYDINTSQYKERREVEEPIVKKIDEENQLENLSFDVNFKMSSFEENSQNALEIKQDVKLNNTLKFNIYPQKHLAGQRKIEKWDDPIAAEETFNMCLHFLSNQY